MGGPAQWAVGVGRRINLKELTAQAGEPVVLVACGPKADLFTAALRAAGEERAGSIVFADSPDDVRTAGNPILTAIVWCAEEESANREPAIAQPSVPSLFVVRLGDATARRGSSYTVSSFELSQLRKYLLPDIVRAYRSHEIAFAAAIPAFRTVVAASLTHACAMTCLKIAAASAIADHVPVLGLLTGGIASAGDTIAITALQMRMLLRIAAAYGKKPELARLLELLPVIGGGYGWRTLAREASGFIPIAGIPIKAAIAYAGTVVVGQVAAHYYETGLRMSTSAIGAAYRDAAQRAKNFARRTIKRRD